MTKDNQQTSRASATLKELRQGIDDVVKRAFEDARAQAKKRPSYTKKQLKKMPLSQLIAAYMSYCDD